MSQRIPLEVDAFFEEGEKLSAGELVSLGIEATARHRIIVCHSPNYIVHNV